MSEINTNLITVEDATKIIELWEKAEKNAVYYQQFLEDATQELHNYNTNKVPLTKKDYAHIGKRDITTARRNMKFFNDPAIRYCLKYYSNHPEERPFSQDIFEKLKEIAKSASAWRKKFDATYAEYSIEQDLYDRSFINEDGILDFLGFLQR